MAEYIEREAVCNDCANRTICVDKSKCTVGRAHAADVVEVVHGAWDFAGENSTGKIFLCSVCGFPHNPNERDVALVRVDEKPNYCPNCGAKMDGGTHNE